MGEALDASRMARSGTSIADMRAAIDAKYAR